MKITNKAGMPEIYVRAVKADDYDRGDSKYSITDLLKPPRILQLERRHEDEIVKDVLDLHWIASGKGFHSMMEGAGQDNALVEERLFQTVNGVKISGQIDLYYPCIVLDFKQTSVWTIIYKSRLKDWAEQLNCYGWLIRKTGFEVNGLKILVHLRDWTKSKMRDEGYPDHPIQMIDLELWDEWIQKHFIKTRIRYHEVNEIIPDNELTHCTSEEMWEQPTKYAVMKKGNKKASRVFEYVRDAEREMMNISGRGLYFIEIRPGKRTRCEDYCDVNHWCNSYQEYLKSKEEK